MKPSRVIREMPRFGMKVLYIIDLCARLFVRYKLTICLVISYVSIFQHILERHAVASDAIQFMTGEQMLDPTYLPPIYIARTAGKRQTCLRRGFHNDDGSELYDPNSPDFDSDMALLMAKEKAAMIEDPERRARALALLNNPPSQPLDQAKKNEKRWEDGPQVLGMI
eukprot:GEMP01047412.1.p1 GENE.GEMP01047412.1~~GEMP01047412.1.p1  ORF type:complete len:167 (+),score=41.06 GEMP01047412.1:425-925(+)